MIFCTHMCHLINAYKEKVFVWINGRYYYYWQRTCISTGRETIYLSGNISAVRPTHKIHDWGKKAPVRSVI